MVLVNIGTECGGKSKTGQITLRDCWLASGSLPANRPPTAVLGVHSSGTSSRHLNRHTDRLASDRCIYIYIYIYIICMISITITQHTTLAGHRGTKTGKQICHQHPHPHPHPHAKPNLQPVTDDRKNTREQAVCVDPIRKATPAKVIIDLSVLDSSVAIINPRPWHEAYPSPVCDE